MDDGFRGFNDHFDSKVKGQGYLGATGSLSISWMPSLSIRRTLKEGRFRMKRLFS